MWQEKPGQKTVPGNADLRIWQIFITFVVKI